MNAAKLTVVVFLAILMTAMAAEEGELDWNKITIDCNRYKKSSHERINQNKGDVHKNDRANIDQVKITANLRSTMKDTISGLSLEVFVIGETAGKNRRDRKPVLAGKKRTNSITLEQYNKVSFVAIETKLVVKKEAVPAFEDDKAVKDYRLSGEEYLGYIALVRDASDKLIFVRAENSKILRIAQDLKIVPKKIELNHKGVVEYKEEEKK